VLAERKLTLAPSGETRVFLSEFQLTAASAGELLWHSRSAPGAHRQVEWKGTMGFADDPGGLAYNRLSLERTDDRQFLQVLNCPVAAKTGAP
jgi:hypothetical protein